MADMKTALLKAKLVTEQQIHEAEERQRIDDVKALKQALGKRIAAEWQAKETERLAKKHAVADAAVEVKPAAAKEGT